MRLVALILGILVVLMSALWLTAHYSINPAAQPEANNSKWLAGNFELVGHHDLLGRGMNSALAVAGNYVYVGSRTEGETHADSGVLIVDVSDPSQPKLVGEIGPPDEALFGISSRELRAVPDKNLLIVLNFSCSTAIHACSRDRNRFASTGGVAERDNFRFYEISDPVHPKLIGHYDFGTFPGSASTAKPHEFYLWRDPQDAERILLYVSTPIGPPSLQVLDISNPANAKLIATWDGRIDAGLTESTGDPDNAYLHSLSISDDGNVAYLAYEGAGFFALGTHEVAENRPSPKITTLTPLGNRVDYTPPHPAGNHSASKVPNRDILIATDEIYGTPLFEGCPWGWLRLIDIQDITQPVIIGEYKAAANEDSRCPQDLGPLRTTHTSHNLTLTQNLAIVTWHSGGLRVIDTSDPRDPVLTGLFMPGALGAVGTEDPALGGNPVTMWSYPVIQNGLIYVTDIRNGLYILRYHGPRREEIDSIGFLEGNSNLGYFLLCGGFC